MWQTNDLQTYIAKSQRIRNPQLGLDNWFVIWNHWRNNHFQTILLNKYQLYELCKKINKKISLVLWIYFWLFIQCTFKADLVCKVNIVITSCSPQSKYQVLHLGALGGTGFLFLGHIGSQASTGKKNLGQLWATFDGVFFMFSLAKKSFFQKCLHCSVRTKKLHNISFMNFIFSFIFSIFFASKLADTRIWVYYIRVS